MKNFLQRFGPFVLGVLHGYVFLSGQAVLRNHVDFEPGRLPGPHRLVDHLFGFADHHRFQYQSGRSGSGVGLGNADFLPGESVTGSQRFSEYGPDVHHRQQLPGDRSPGDDLGYQYHGRPARELYRDA